MPNFQSWLASVVVPLNSSIDDDDEEELPIEKDSVMHASHNTRGGAKEDVMIGFDVDLVKGAPVVLRGRPQSDEEESLFDVHRLKHTPCEHCLPSDIELTSGVCTCTCVCTCVCV